MRFYLFNIIFILILVSPTYAKENNIIISHDEKITNYVDNFFLKNPKQKIFTWMPVVDGKHRFKFLIPKDAYFRSKHNNDANDLYYLTKKIDEGLSLHSTNVKRIDFLLSKNDKKLIYTQNLFSNVNGGLFFKNNDRPGLFIDKDFVLYKNILGNLEIENTEGDYPIIKTRFSNLLLDENSEVFVRLNYIHKSQTMNNEINYTWFDVKDNFDIILGLHKDNKDLSSKLYASSNVNNMKWKLGVNKSKKKINLFFEFSKNFAISRHKINSYINISSENFFDSYRKSTLKDIRTQNQELTWRNGINFDN